MEYTITDPGPNRRITITGELTIADAAQLRDALALALSTSKTLELNLAELAHIDVAGVQILTTLLREPLGVQISQASPALQRLAALLCLEPLNSACQVNSPCIQELAS